MPDFLDPQVAETWLKWLVVPLVLVALGAVVFIGERCPSCRARMDRTSFEDPLHFKKVRITILKVPRLAIATYRCPKCGTEIKKSELTSGEL